MSDPTIPILTFICGGSLALSVSLAAALYISWRYVFPAATKRGRRARPVYETVNRTCRANQTEMYRTIARMGRYGFALVGTDPYVETLGTVTLTFQREEK